MLFDDSCANVYNLPEELSNKVLDFDPKRARGKTRKKSKKSKKRKSKKYNKRKSKKSKRK
jgi:hypothetical protein